MSTCLNLPSLSCSLSSEDIPHTLTLALLQLTLTSYRTLSSYPLLLNLPLLFSPSVSPPSNKGDMSLAQRLFLSLSFFIPFALSLSRSLLHLSIKPTKGGRCSAFRFLFPLFLRGCTFSLRSHLSPSVSSILFHPPLSHSLSLIPSVPSH